MRPLRHLPIIAVLSILTSPSCDDKPTISSILEPHRPALLKLRETLRSIAVPDARAGAAAPAEPLAPQPLLLEGTGDTSAGNTVLLMSSMLSGRDDTPEADTPSYPRELNISESQTMIRFVFHALEVSADEMAQYPDSVRRAARAAAGLRYVLVAVVRELRWGGATFGGAKADQLAMLKGHAELDGLLVDLESGETVCAFQVSAEPRDSVSFSVPSGQGTTTRASAAVRSALRGAARRAFLEAFEQRCGGRAELR